MGKRLRINDRMYAVRIIMAAIMQAFHSGSFCGGIRHAGHSRLHLNFQYMQNAAIVVC
jgi:hypothetical protein